MKDFLIDYTVTASTDTGTVTTRLRDVVTACSKYDAKRTFKRMFKEAQPSANIVKITPVAPTTSLS